MAEPKPAVVYDINVLVGAFVGPDSDWPYLAQVPPTTSNADADALSIAFDADEFRLYSSPHILENLARVLAELGVQPARAATIVDAVLEIVETSGGAVVDPPRKAFDVADHEDNLILDLAIAVEATLVVSNDTDRPSRRFLVSQRGALRCLTSPVAWEQGQLSEGVSMAAKQTTITPTEAVPHDIALIAAEVEKGQQLAGHFPDAEALDRGRRVYRGHLTTEDARAELDAKYSRG